MIGTCIAIVVTLIALVATYVLSVRHIKPIISSIALGIWYFAKDQNKLTTEAIRNITWNDHDRLFWVVTSTWLLSMIFSALIVIVLFELFG